MRREGKLMIKTQKENAVREDLPMGPNLEEKI